MLSKLLKSILKHKILATMAVLLIVGGGYFAFKNLASDQETAEYVTSAVKRGTLIVSVSGSGQVLASDQVDIKPKVSGEVVHIAVQNGQKVKAGDLLVQIDINNAQRAVQEAEIALETAKVQLAELLEPPDELTVLQTENSLAKAKGAKQKAENNIVEGYEDAFNAITDVFFDLPVMITGLNNILYSYEIAASEKAFSGYWNVSVLANTIDVNQRDKLTGFTKTAEDSYKISRTKYDKNLKNYKETSRYAEPHIIEALLEETLETLRAVAETVKNEINLLDFWVDYRSQRNLPVFSKVTEYQSNLKSYTSKTNSHLSNLLKIQRSFQDNRQAVVDAEYSIKEKELALEKLIAGPDELDVRAKEITIQQKEDALDTAKENLANCYVYAPFDGIVAEVFIKKGDAVSSGTKLLTLASEQKTAEITLNEIDMAKIELKQKATIAFDAIDDLIITGKVVEVDTIGTVSQGVVTYDIAIALDTQDERIKPGMSISATIITEAKQNVFLAPNSAIKYQGNSAYVEVLINNIPQPQAIEVGIANDMMTEIVSGLEEGDEIITQTISAGTTLSTNSQFAPSGGSMQREMMRMIR